MSQWRVNLVSAFGRGETLAMALRDAGFTVQILDFTQTFAAEYQRGVGPFPVVDQTFHPAQRDYLDEAKPLTQGLSFWLKDGPIELTGPLAEIHSETHPAIKAWKNGAASGLEFGTQWLQRFMRQWTSAYFRESWAQEDGTPFPADLPLGIIPEGRESAAQSFARVQTRGVEVHGCQGLLDIRTHAGRLQELDVEAAGRLTVAADQWVWCLSSSETQKLGSVVGSKVFWRGHCAPEWAWMKLGCVFG